MLAPSQRHAFQHQGRTVYEWEQTLEDVSVFVPLPPGVRARDLAVAITASKLSVGIKGNPPYLDEELSLAVKADDSLWAVDGAELTLTLTKQAKGKAWASPFARHAPQGASAAADADQRRLMLERFQEENPGFDFSRAEFNGNVPDPSEFMGGISTTQ